MNDTTNGVMVTDPETGMYIIGYSGQTREALKAELEHRKEQMSVLTLVRKK